MTTTHFGLTATVTMLILLALTGNALTDDEVEALPPPLFDSGAAGKHGEDARNAIKNVAAQIQKAAEDAIKSVGGEIGYYNLETGQEEKDKTKIAAENKHDKDKKKSEAKYAKFVRFTNSNLTDQDLIRLTWALDQISDPKDDLPLAKLDLRFTKVTGVGLWQRMHLPELVDLDLSSTLVDGRELCELTRFEKLKYLRLNHDRLMIDGLGEYFYCWRSSLRTGLHLYLSHVSIIESDIVVLPNGCVASKMPELAADEWLGKLIRSGQTDCDFLEGLDISNNGVTKTDVLKALTKVTELSLAGNKKVSDDQLAFLSERHWAERTTSLDLTGTGLTDMGLNSLKTYRKLESLSLSNTNVTDSPNLVALVNNNSRSLKNMDISNTRTMVRVEMQKAIGRLLNLTTLSISGTGIDDAGMKNICLELQHGAVGNENQPYYLGRLASLDVSKTIVTDRWLILFDNDGQGLGVGLPALAFIYLSDKMTAAGIQHRDAYRGNFPVNLPPDVQETPDRVLTSGK